MSRISDEVYNYLYYKNEPVEFGEIVKNALSGSLSRKEVSDTLRELQSEDKAFRSIKSGKAYYSVHSEQGEAMNPLRKNNSQYSGGLFNPFASLFGQLAQAAAEDEEDTEDRDLSAYDLSFDYGKNYECAAYTVGIPDACVLNKNSENRDFLAWIPDETDPEDENVSPLILMSSENLANEAISGLKIKEAAQIVIKIVADNLANTLGSSSCHVIAFPEESGVGSCVLMYSGCWHAYTLAMAENEIVRLRAQFNNLKLKDREVADRVVLEWLKTFRLKKPKTFLRELDDASYATMPLNQENVSQYDADITQYLNYVDAARNMSINQAVQSAQQSGNKSVAQIILDIKSELFESADCKANIYRKIAKTVTSLAVKNPENPLVADLYTKAISHLTDKEELTVDDEKIFAPVTGIEEIKASFKTKEIMKYAEELERLEKERKAKAERQAMLEKKFSELKSAYESAETEKDFQTVVAGLKELTELPEAKEMYDAAEAKRQELEAKRLAFESLNEDEKKRIKVEELEAGFAKEDEAYLKSHPEHDPEKMDEILSCIRNWKYDLEDVDDAFNRQCERITNRMYSGSFTGLYDTRLRALVDQMDDAQKASRRGRDAVLDQIHRTFEKCHSNGYPKEVLKKLVDYYDIEVDENATITFTINGTVLCKTAISQRYKDYLRDMKKLLNQDVNPVSKRKNEEEKALKAFKGYLKNAKEENDSFDTDAAELKEELAESQADYDKASSKLKDLVDNEPKKRAEIVEKFDSIIATAKANLEKTTAQLHGDSSELGRNEKELASLGLFAFSRKKELRAIIEKLSGAISAGKNQVTKLNEEISNNESEKERSLKKLANELDKAKTELKISEDNLEGAKECLKDHLDSEEEIRTTFKELDALVSNFHIEYLYHKHILKDWDKLKKKYSNR